MAPLAGKKIVIVGASTGIGFGTLAAYIAVGCA
jgi:NAD(P)-dependent dehydrogenase (short-subunit alcohol dehydrogenase family)